MLHALFLQTFGTFCFDYIQDKKVLEFYSKLTTTLVELIKLLQNKLVTEVKYFRAIKIYFRIIKSKK